MNRTFAIINQHLAEIDYTDTIISKLPSDSRVFVFIPCIGATEVNMKNVSDTITEIHFPVADKITIPICYNFASKYLKETLGISGYLYLFRDTIGINDKDKFEAFMPELEEMLDKLELDTWFNTTTDMANYVFSRYDPRIRTLIDEPKYAAVYNKSIYWAMCANENLICFNMDKVTLDQMLFSEDFSVGMFYILEYISRRRFNENDSWPFINFYPTLQSEIGIISYVLNDTQLDNATYAREQELFKSRQIQIQPDAHVEVVLKFITDKLSRFL